MKIYILLCEDRHTDTLVCPFSSAEKAISAARALAKEYARFPEDYMERECKAVPGCLLVIDYSCEGDHVRVVETDLDEDF